jgi:hypothetical protein
VEDSLTSDIEFRSNELIISSFGQEVYSSGPVHILAAYSENIDAFSYLAICDDIQEEDRPVDPVTNQYEEIAFEVKLDMSDSSLQDIALPST